MADHGIQDRPQRKTASQTGRKHMGAGEFLMPASPPFAFRISTPAEKTHWRPHDPGDQVRVEFAGTAVTIDGDLYEVVQHRPPTDPPSVEHQGSLGSDLSDQNSAHVYLLAPWDDRHPLRGPAYEYSIEALRQERQMLRRAEHEQKAGTRLDWLGVLTALLPARDQRHLAENYGFDAVFWSRWSALVWTILWFGAGIAILGGAPLGGGEILALLVVAAFLIEQFYRRGKVMVGEPCGSMLGVLFRFLVPKHLRAGH